MPAAMPCRDCYRSTASTTHATACIVFTISESERASIVASPTMRHLTYEGVAYYASVVSAYGFTPLYRFYVAARGFHFYTASESEKNSLIATASATHNYEGVAYQVLASTWREMRVPHSYVTADQCHQAGVHTLITCSNVAATSLNPLQDGHRASTNPQSYGTVFRLVGLTPIAQPSTSCVFDGVTGLTWEGKTNDGGVRDKDPALHQSGHRSGRRQQRLCGGGQRVGPVWLHRLAPALAPGAVQPRELRRTRRHP